MEPELERLALAIYHEVKSLAGQVIRGGWRPLIGWVGVYMMFGIAWRIAHGYPLPNVAEILGAIIPTMGVALMRSCEKYTEAKIGVTVSNFPGGGLVNHA